MKSSVECGLKAVWLWFGSSHADNKDVDLSSVACKYSIQKIGLLVDSDQPANSNKVTSHKAKKVKFLNHSFKGDLSQRLLFYGMVLFNINRSHIAPTIRGTHLGFTDRDTSQSEGEF